ncbi:MAG: TetR/AcrR family transcriptional regulator [Atopobiaceae bacterium]|nr:TetR/AcrR family transcriptional regulator [Atopobiaceae bacterium]
MAERGNAAKVSVTDVTTAMGITRGLFYYYFGGKEELNESIVLSYVDDLMAIIGQRCTSFDDREASVRTIVECVHDWLYEEDGTKRPQWHVLDETGLQDFLNVKASNELAGFIVNHGLLAKYGRGDDDSLREHARFVALGILGELRLQPDVPICRVGDAACAALRYRKRRSSQDAAQTEND